MTATRRDARYLARRVVARKRGPFGDAPRTWSLEELPGRRRAEAGGGVRAERAHSTSSGRQASRSRKRACGERVALALAGAHKAAFDGMCPGRCAGTPPQACARPERPYRSDTHEASGDTLRDGSTVASPQPGARQRAEQGYLWDVIPETRRGRRTAPLGQLCSARFGAYAVAPV